MELRLLKCRPKLAWLPTKWQPQPKAPAAQLDGLVSHVSANQTAEQGSVLTAHNNHSASILTPSRCNVTSSRDSPGLWVCAAQQTSHGLPRRLTASMRLERFIIQGSSFVSSRWLPADVSRTPMPVPPAHDVINRAGILHSHRARHEATLTKTPPSVKRPDGGGCKPSQPMGEPRGSNLPAWRGRPAFASLSSK